jgi:hypothetical protein
MRKESSRFVVPEETANDSDVTAIDLAIAKIASASANSSEGGLYAFMTESSHLS